MAKKIKLTRPELKRRRDMLVRFERYLPMLKLKQQQLQTTLRDIDQKRAAAQNDYEAAREKFESYSNVMNDRAGISVAKLAECKEVKTSRENIAGINIPVFEDVLFEDLNYSLFATPVWVDGALGDLREANRQQARLDILRQQSELLHRELTKIVQRVNLFDKVKIPESREAIRVIRIFLGDEMTAAVGRAKIAKGKLSEEGPQEGLDHHSGEVAGEEIPA